MDEIQQFCSSKRVPAHLTQRIQQYYQSLYERMGGFSSSIEQAIGELPVFMKNEISMFLYAPLISKVGFVKQALVTDPEQTTSFIKALVGDLQQQLILAGDAVVSKGDWGEEMYLVVSGSLNVVIEGDIVVATLGPGTHFGETACLLSEPRTATVVAAELCEVLVLHRESVLPLLSQFSAVQACANKVIESRKVARSQAMRSGGGLMRRRTVRDLQVEASAGKRSENGGSTARTSPTVSSGDDAGGKG